MGTPRCPLSCTIPAQVLATSVALALLAQRTQEAEEKPLTSLGMTPKQASGTAEAS